MDLSRRSLTFRIHVVFTRGDVKYNDAGYLIMKWDSGNTVEVYFDLNTGRARVNGKNGTIEYLNGMLCFTTYENELICTDA